MRLRYSFKPQARRDVVEIAAAIAADNPSASRAFLKALEDTCKNLAAMPEIGSRRTFRHPALKDVRMLPVNKFNSYLIFYQPMQNVIEIVRIVHGARDLPGLFAA